MKILLATSKAIPGGGGIASYNQELVNLLGKENKIYLLTNSNESNVPGYLHTFQTFGHSNTDVEYCKRLLFQINSSNYDCIINSNSPFIPLLSPFINAPIIGISHFVNGKLALNAGYNAKWLSAIVALSKYGKKFLDRKFDIKDNQKVKIIYNFVETATKPQLNKLNQSPIKIVFPGGTSIFKSVDVIQQLVYKLLSSNLHFEFYWLGGTNLPSASMSLLGLKHIQNLFQPDKRLQITGNLPRQEAMDIIGSANIFLLPSRGEGCPMTLLEAMRGGCIPIVSDAKHGSLEIIKESNAGFIVKQGDSQEIFNLIGELISNHNHYVHIYSESNSFLNTYLSQEIWAKKMNELISDVVSSNKPFIPFNKRKFIISTTKFHFLNYVERLKAMILSAVVRVKIELSYIRNVIFD